MLSFITSQSMMSLRYEGFLILISVQIFETIITLEEIDAELATEALTSDLIQSVSEKHVAVP